MRCGGVLCGVDSVEHRTRVQNLCLNHGVEVAPSDSTTAKNEALCNARRNRGVNTWKHEVVRAICHTGGDRYFLCILTIMFYSRTV
jgi:hypothetical protein